MRPFEVNHAVVCIKSFYVLHHIIIQKAPRHITNAHRWFIFSFGMLSGNGLLEGPLCGNCRQSIKAIVLSSLVPHKIVTKFYLASETQVDALHAFQRV